MTLPTSTEIFRQLVARVEDIHKPFAQIQVKIKLLGKKQKKQKTQKTTLGNHCGQ